MRTATVETTHDDAAAIAAAIAPDNTSEMTTTVDGDRVVTRIERGTTSGLQSTVDDYVVNVDVAERVVQTANQQTTHNT